jgi:hypothetical protein
MSKTYYDHLIVLEKVEVVIRESTQTPEEREELWQLIDEIIHHRVLQTVLTHLPDVHHKEFLTKFHETPHDDLLLSYLSEKSEKDIENILQEEIELLENELLRELRGK